MLSSWTLEIHRGSHGVLDFLGVVAAGFVPETEADAVLELIAPSLAKAARSQIPTPIPMLARDTTTFVASFDGSAKPKRAGGSRRGSSQSGK
jgi:hypothetical protein